MAGFIILSLLGTSKQITSCWRPLRFAHKTIQVDLLLWDSLGAINTSNETRAPEWELFDLKEDPYELNNVYYGTGYTNIVKQL